LYFKIHASWRWHVLQAYRCTL